MNRLHFQLLLILATAVTSVAYGQDAAAVSPNIYQVLFETDDIRVLEISISPGERDEPHSHPRYMIFVREGGTLMVHPRVGEAYEATVERGQTQILDPVEQH